MTMRIATLCAALLLLTANVPAQTQDQPTFPSRAVGVSMANLHQLFSQYWAWRMANEPEFATVMGVSDYNDRWRDWSKAGRDRAREYRLRVLQLLSDISSGNLTQADRLSAWLLQSDLQGAIDGDPYVTFVGRLSQMAGAGPHNQVFTVIDQMPAGSVKDYENIIARVRALPAYVDQHIELFREQLAIGLAQPALVVDLVAGQIAVQRKTPVADSRLLAAFNRFPDAVPAAERERLRRQAVAAYDEQFVPSWTRLETFLRETYRPRSQAGLGSVPSGQKAYEVLARYFTSTSMSPKEIHELGLKEVARIEREMQAVAKSAGFTGTVSEFERQLAARPDQHFTSRDEMLEYARAVIKRVEPELPRLFRRLPKMAVGVRPIAPDAEAASASNYTVGTTDGSRPAWFNLNTYRPTEQVKYPMEAVVLHEAMPGHHLQVALARELENVPDFRRAFGSTAFSEGWGLYSEALGYELGAYRDPATRFGQLSTELFRAVRLVVDTGIHSLGWPREQALEYFTQHVPGQSIAEVDRYIAWPGQALAYKIGELKIRELRKRAQDRLGARFDLRDFHDAVLRNGALPLDLLEQEIDRYIATTDR